jgi:5-methylcytosine-specific restriction endonuclease McrA
MSSVVLQRTSLRLNSSWQPVGIATIKDALVAMNSSGYANSVAPARGMDIEFPQIGENEWDFSNPNILGPKKWEDWINLPIRPYDIVIHTPKLTIRAPHVIIAVHYNKIHKKHFKPTVNGIWERDGGRCQVTGKKLTKETGNIDHLISRSRWKKLGLPGTPDTWQNMVLMSRDINSQKGERTLEECGLKLIKSPKAPLPLPVTATIKQAKHASWTPFLLK